MKQNKHTQTHSGVSGHEAQERQNAAKKNTCVFILREDTEILISFLWPPRHRAPSHQAQFTRQFLHFSLRHAKTANERFINSNIYLSVNEIIINTWWFWCCGFCSMPLKFCVRNAIEPTADISIFVRTHREVLFVIRNETRRGFSVNFWHKYVSTTSFDVVISVACELCARPKQATETDRILIN